MGLDMYLNKRVYVGAEYKHRDVKGKIEITVKGEPLNINFSRVTYIEEQVGYWRKANAIHKWFVDHVQDGKDDCQSSEVSEENLRELLSNCKAVKERHDLAESLLPPKAGFFFGSTNLDEGYYRDVDDTIKIIEELLAEKGAFLEDIIYRASW